MEKNKGRIIRFQKSENCNILKGKPMGTITISVLLDEYTHLPFYYIEPDTKDLLPYVDLLDDTLSKHTIKG